MLLCEHHIQLIMIARKRPKALVLTVEPPLGEQITAMMEANWDCEVVGTPEKALARLKAAHFDAVMTNYKLPQLPQGNALHFISCLRQEGITVPAIVMSEDDEVLRTVPKEALNIPAVLRKPFTASDLRAAFDALSVA